MNDPEAYSALSLHQAIDAALATGARPTVAMATLVAWDPPLPDALQQHLDSFGRALARHLHHHPTKSIEPSEPSQ